MKDQNDTEAEPQFSHPIRQIVMMLLVLVLVGGGTYVAFATILAIFESNIYLNGLILAVFALGVLTCFRQVIQLVSSVGWIERFARTQQASDEGLPPSLLAPLATLLRSRGARMQLSATSTRSILESVAQRIDEDREITRYLSNTLIFLGLLGTFYGLATTVPALVDTIRSLSAAEGETGADIFARLQAGLEQQLDGMGTAFSSSLLGLAGSLIIGLLELFVGHGQNRFYRELEEWLSSITRVSFASGDETGVSDAMVMAQVIDNLAEQMESLQLMFTQTDINRSEIDGRMSELAQSITRLAGRMEASDATPALLRIAEGQERLISTMSQHGGGGDGIDAESRMRLRSIDVQLLRILEEIAAGREETTAELRSDLANLTRTVRGLRTVREPGHSPTEP
ncbi:MAG: biopolymer transporter ExbB [Rubellimicrobium sp.]|nr:biopolymer transporter ExbB [Rubellimicrobium sp.]